MTKSIGWGIIGCGNVTEVKSGPGFQKARDSRLVAVMRRDAAKAADYAQRHNVARWYSDASALIADPQVDAVYIATPPSSHAEYTIAAAKAGKPVYVEKPMALSYRECLYMIGACEDAGVALMVAYYRRALPRFLKVKELLENGAIGKVCFAAVQLYYPPSESDFDAAHLPWRVIPEISGGGKFVDLASHTLDILDFFFGPVCDISGHASNQMGKYRAEDIVSASMVHESGVHVSGIWCFSAATKHDTISIVGSKGQINLSTFGDEPILLQTDSGAQTFQIENPATIQLPLIQTVVDSLNGSGTCPSTGESAARTSMVIDKILETYRVRM